MCLLTSCGIAQDLAEGGGQLNGNDSLVLINTARLESYWQTPITLEQSLCLQDHLGQLGLRAVAGEQAMNDRIADRLRRAWEQCSPVSDSAPGVRLVREARVRYQAAVLRLQGPEQQLRLCSRSAQDKAWAQSCLQRVLGRAPSDAEARWLLALAPRRP